MIYFSRTPPYLSANQRLSSHMLLVIVALTPAIATLLFYYGYDIILNILIACSSALVIEATVLGLRQQAIKPRLSDGSAVVTALLIALVIPTSSPWWLIVTGVGFALLFGKHLYGGLGHNPFNPAMLAYVMLLISFPIEMTQWPVPTPEANWSFLFSFSPTIIDGVSTATPLDYLKNQANVSAFDITLRDDPHFPHHSSHAFFWLNIAYLIGGLFLLWRRVISWHIPIAVLIGFSGLSLISWFIMPATVSPLFQLCHGGTFIAAFFIATDPVSSSTTQRGRLIYGLGIGLLAYLIRFWGNYPDGFAFAVLLMNMLVPLIDYYTQPRVYGGQ